MLLAGALLLGALLIAWAGKIWREDQKKGSGKPEDQLSEFRSMLDSGEISQEEFEKLRQTLGKKDTSARYAQGSPPSQPKSRADPSQRGCTTLPDLSQTTNLAEKPDSIRKIPPSFSRGTFPCIGRPSGLRICGRVFL